MSRSKKKTKRKPKLRIITSPLNNAIVNGNLKKVKELLKKGENPNEFTNEWCSPKVNKWKVKHVGIDCKLDDIGCICGSLGTSLHLALFFRNKKIIHALLDQGVDINLTHDSFKVSPLQLGVYCGIDIIKELYKKGCKDVNYIDFEGYSVLMHAVSKKHASTKDDRLDIIKFLVSKGANVNYKENVSGSTPLEMACKIGHINVIKYLISKGTNVNNVNKRKNSLVKVVVRVPNLLIWRMQSPDDRKLVNNRHHDTQFSVSTRLTGYSRYGGGFNYLGGGNFFGQIGEIRISNVCRYGR